MEHLFRLTGFVFTMRLYRSLWRQIILQHLNTDECSILSAMYRGVLNCAIEYYKTRGNGELHGEIAKYKN